MLSSQNKNKLISLLEHKNYEAVGDSFIIFPDDVNLLGQIIKISNRFGIKIIPIGNGSSFGKDFKSSLNSVFLSTQRLNKIIDLDKSNMFVEIQAGCAWKQLFSDLAGQGLYFPVNVVDVRTVAGHEQRHPPRQREADALVGARPVMSTPPIVTFLNRAESSGRFQAMPLSRPMTWLRAYGGDRGQGALRSTACSSSDGDRGLDAGERIVAVHPDVVERERVDRASRPGSATASAAAAARARAAARACSRWLR